MVRTGALLTQQYKNYLVEPELPVAVQINTRPEFDQHFIVRGHFVEVFLEGNELLHNYLFDFASCSFNRNSLHVKTIVRRKAA